METISIVGYGRFGKTLARLLKDNFTIEVYDPSIEVSEEDNIKSIKTVTDIYKNQTIFYCVPISGFEKVVSDHSKYFVNHLLIDVLSVKLHSKKVFEKYLKETNSRALLTHPMFGPDSSKNGFENLPIVLDKFTATDEEYKKWISVFEVKKLSVIEMSADEHDKLAANSQGVTHFTGRLLDQIGFIPTEIDTAGAKILHQIKEQTCNDTWQLFLDLQRYNPYTEEMRLNYGKAYDDLYNQILPEKTEDGFVTYGIQGGLGSFNEEAINYYIDRENISNPKVKYLYTTERVLQNLHEGKIDYGLFAIVNSIGGIVSESIHAMANYKYRIVAELPISITHHLMKLKSVDKSDLKTVMAHPQVFRQCKNNMESKYPSLEQKVGEGDLIDTAKAASELHEGNLPKTTAILGPKGLADIYDLDIVESELQDDPNNKTTFLLVARI